MKKIIFTNIILILLISVSCKNKKETENNTKTIAVSEKQSDTSVKITPISHATAVISFDETIIYLDPTGGKDAFADFEKPTYVLITDTHGDHMNLSTLKELNLTETKIIAPKAVIDKISDLTAKEFITLNNGEEKSMSNFTIEAIPMYNLREEALKFHEKGRGNGYILSVNNERIYFSGDTEDIPEMRNLKNIDKAFVCMNLPYTMTVESAADAVLAFEPKQVFPYHYRGTEGLSDVDKFKRLVNEKNNSIKVIQWNWYPKK
ncbi:MBL fold metallo-hydrolase [Polaribacter aestuariivivens]|uniref:MBL fold metallo-hydrolase n=1 Tax=Polaribacter aestuariivivens TaxID=2304626 RepID=UPI003F49A4E5